jgi:hypothetical protein
MQRNRILATALAGGLFIGTASTGYVIAQLVSPSGHDYTGQYQPAANLSTGSAASPSRGAAGASPAARSTPAGTFDPVPPAPSSAPATPGTGNAFSDPSLAQFIAQKAGTGLAGRAPQNVPVSQVTAVSDQQGKGA